MRAKILARLNYVEEHQPQSADRVFGALERLIPDWRERIA